MKIQDIIAALQTVPSSFIDMTVRQIHKSCDSDAIMISLVGRENTNVHVIVLEESVEVRYALMNSKEQLEKHATHLTHKEKK